MHKEVKTYLLQALLFIVTFITTTLAGMNWMGLEEYSWVNFCKGLQFSIPFLGILTIHEFGHYIAARIYKVVVTLPYYIPMFIPGMLSIGTMGAFIKIKSPLLSKKMVMDIGIAGPLAGFVVAIGVLFYGFTHLPAKEDIFEIHPSYKTAYKKYGPDYEKHVYNYEFARDQDSISDIKIKKSKSEFTDKLESLGLLEQGWREKSFKAKPQYEEISMGDNLLMVIFEKYVANDPSLIPNKFEIFHSPFIFAGFLALFFTAMNLLPMGQLDGGHVIYGLFGFKKHKLISTTALIILIYFAGVGIFRNNIFSNAHTSLENLLFFGVFYMYWLYMIFSRVSTNWKNNLLIASGVFAAQYFTEIIFPGFNGISAIYLVFGTLVGRLLGVEHPPTFIEEPLSLSRKILGWLSLIIFILCFTPNLFNVEIFSAY